MGRVLFGHRVVITWQKAAVQIARDLLDPTMVKMVKDPGINFRPVVNRHNQSFSRLVPSRARL
jgi:hypothetical protein